MDVFWKVIRDEIKAAKAVIVIWSARAIDSEWVYAEAKLAHEMKKLICVRTSDVPAYDVPMPFNGYNVTTVDERQKIHDALTKLGLKAGRSAPLPKGEMEVTEVTAAWGEAKASGNPKLVEAFIRHYRDRHPFFAELAEAFLAELPAGRGGVVVAKPAEVPLPQAGDVFLRIEPGMHTARINRIGVDAAGTLMATGSNDKTARLWALPEGGRGEARLLRTLRVPIGEGDDGKVNAVALSPDSQWVAAGGYMEKDPEQETVYIFEAATGRLVTRLGRLDEVVYHLAFSPDGSRLATTLGAGEGMRLWEAESWRLLAEDKDYGGKSCNGAAFDGANRLYTVAYDGQIRRYGAEGRLEGKAKTAGGAEPYSVAVHPKGGKLAVGFGDTTAVEVYDATSLMRLHAANTDGISGGSLNAVAWSADGSRLYAGGRTGKSGPKPVQIWQDEGRGKRAEAPLAQSTIIQLLPCGAGLAAGTTDPAFGLIAADGGKRVWQEGVTADMRGKKRDAFAIAADGSSVRFGLGQGSAEPVLFDLAAFRLTDAPQTAGLRAAQNLRPRRQRLGEQHRAEAERQAHRAKGLRDLARARHRAGRLPLRARHGMEAAHLSRRWRRAVAEACPRRRLWREHRRRRQARCGGLCRRHHPLAPALRRAGVARAVRPRRGPPLHRLDAARLLRRLARRRRPHRLARQSRLRHRPRLLPRLDLRQHL